MARDRVGPSRRFSTSIAAIWSRLGTSTPTCWDSTRSTSRTRSTPSVTGSAACSSPSASTQKPRNPKPIRVRSGRPNSDGKAAHRRRPHGASSSAQQRCARRSHDSDDTVPQYAAMRPSGSATGAFRSRIQWATRSRSARPTRVHGRVTRSRRRLESQADGDTPSPSSRTPALVHERLHSLHRRTHRIQRPVRSELRRPRPAGRTHAQDGCRCLHGLADGPPQRAMDTFKWLGQER